MCTAGKWSLTKKNVKGENCFHWLLSSEIFNILSGKSTFSRNTLPFFVCIFKMWKNSGYRISALSCLSLFAFIVRGKSVHPLLDFLNSCLSLPLNVIKARWGPYWSIKRIWVNKDILKLNAFFLHKQSNSICEVPLWKDHFSNWISRFNN